MKPVTVCSPHDAQYPNAVAHVRATVERAISAFQVLLNDARCLAQVARAAAWVGDALRDGRKVLLCGNGGSAADAQHVSAEFVCRFLRDRRALPVVALTTDSSVLTSIANDYAYEEVFRRQVEALGQSGDVLIGISTSGSSQNVLRAFEAAARRQMRTVLLTGAIEREISKISDCVICVPSTETPLIQEMHLVLEHVLCDLVERAFV